MIQSHEMSRTGKPIDTESRLVVARSWGERGQREVTAYGYGFLFWGDTMFGNGDGGCTTLGMNGM